MLKLGETKRTGDEYLNGSRWVATKLPGEKIKAPSLPVRRRTSIRTIKAIATRATVRAAFQDGAMISDSITCETGLSVEMMAHVAERWDLASKRLPTSSAKYIMLEIQREGES